MKLLTLNIWGGTVFQPLIKFVKAKGKTVDIFCFQEVFNTTSKQKVSGRARANMFQELKRVLPNHHGYFKPALKACDFEGLTDPRLSFGLALFVRKNLRVKKLGEIFIHKSRGVKVSFLGNMPRNLLYALIENHGKKYLIANMHGLWKRGGKADSPATIKQSYKARRLMDKFSCPKLICGDFNLLPNTKSITILDKGMVNLIKKHKIKSTRTKLYKHYYEHPLFADYIIASPDLKVKNFKVLKDQVSDHAALTADFN